ncbi:MAG TPA: hypothetical protein PKB08_10435, partial [Burkholderiaceae bacterium]|nr:hypothetical protein [Burkholderiaceae bacterium]
RFDAGTGIDTAVPTLAQPMGPETAGGGAGYAPAPAAPAEPAPFGARAPAPGQPPSPGAAPREPEAGAREPERSDEEGTERRLLEILDSLDLGDLPSSPRRRELAPEQALGEMRRGDWVELVARDGSSAYLKVAWINRRRTVALLVRRADRRAMSLRMEELRARFDQARAFLVAER